MFGLHDVSVATSGTASHTPWAPSAWRVTTGRAGRGIDPNEAQASAYLVLGEVEGRAFTTRRAAAVLYL